MKPHLDGLNWRKVLKFKSNFSEFIFWQTAAGIAAIIIAIIVLSLIYRNNSNFANELMKIFASRVLFTGIIILIFNIVLSYFGLKSSFSKIENLPSARIMISVMTFIWMLIVIILTGMIWL